MRRAAKTLETAYPPRRAAAAEMRKALGAYLAEQGLDAAAAYEVVLAADEAFINAVIHAGGAGDEIRVSACVTEHKALIEVHDDGGGFGYQRPDPRAVPDVRRANGRGVFLIASMMDEVSVRSERRGTTVRMVKSLA